MHHPLLCFSKLACNLNWWGQLGTQSWLAKGRGWHDSRQRVIPMPNNTQHTMSVTTENFYHLKLILKDAASSLLAQ